MSYTEPVNPYDTPDYARGHTGGGMSGAAKVLLGMGIGCGLLAMLCCGVFGFGSYWLVRTARQSITEDPETVRLLTESIVTIDVPQSLPPKVGMDLNVPVVGRKFMTWVAYGSESDENGLFLAQFANGMFDEEDMRVQWRESMRQSGQWDGGEIEVEESEDREVEVNGSPARFRVSRGRESGTQEPAWQVSGSFRGKGGPALLLLKVRGEQFSKEQVLAILDSMR